MFASSKTSAAILALLVAHCVSTSECERTGASRDAAVQQATDEPGALAREREDLRLRHNSRLLAVPYSLARFLSYNSRAGGLNGLTGSVGGAGGGESAETTSNRQLAGYKRSSSALDALTGVTLGKRSTDPFEFVNFEPVFARQHLTRGHPRVYDMRWAPLDASDSTGAGSNSNYYGDNYGANNNNN